MLEWMIAVGALCGAVAVYGIFVTALDIVLRLDGQLSQRLLPPARVVRCPRCRRLAAPRGERAERRRRHHRIAS